jgi:predicted transcriptional regulator
MSKVLSITIQLSDKLQESISELSAQSGLSVEALAQDALEQYVDWRAEQIRDLQSGIAAADRGDFVPESEVKALFARYGA